MGVKSFFHEVKAKVSPSRMFKAVITESPDVIPKALPNSIKSLEVVGGGALTAGCILQTNFADGARFKYMKNKIDVVDTENYVCKYTLVEGEVLDKLEKVCYEVKFEASEDGGCLVKIKSEYHTKDGNEIKDEDIQAGKEHSLGFYKACEDYLIANPHICA